jgi:hypothetical protein
MRDVAQDAEDIEIHLAASKCRIARTVVETRALIASVLSDDEASYHKRSGFLHLAAFRKSSCVVYVE